MIDPKERLLGIWELSSRLGAELERLDKLEPNRLQRAAISSVQAQYRWWRGSNLGELLNLFEIPPEERR